MMEILRRMGLAKRGTIVPGDGKRADRTFRREGGLVVHPEDADYLLDNYIITSHYTIINFIPKNLFEQFHSIANLYFLFIGILQMIPSVSTTDGRPSMYSTLFFILFVSAFRSALEDRVRHREDNKRNSFPYKAIREKGPEMVASGLLVVGDIVKVKKDCMFPADMLFIGSSTPQGHCFIDKAALNGETRLEIKNSLLETRELCKNEVNLGKWEVKLTYEHANGKFGSFRGNMQFGDVDLALDGKVLLQREEVLRNTDYIYGLVVYTGKHTKIQMSTRDSDKTVAKTSTIMKKVNEYLIGMFFIQFLFCFIGGIAAGVWAKLNMQTAWYIYPKYAEWTESPALIGFYGFFTWFILLCQLVPISLQVTSEFVKVFMTLWLQWDKEMYSEALDKPLKCNNSTIHEELGLVDYIFSDKTGTLTQNKMEFRYVLTRDGDEYGSKMTEIAKAVLSRQEELKRRTEMGDAYVEPVVVAWTDLMARYKKAQEDPEAAAAAGISINEFTAVERQAVLQVLYGAKPSEAKLFDWQMKRNSLQQFIRHMALSNTIETYVQNGVLKFQAESAEELAMVQFAQSLGFVKTKINPSVLEIHEYDTNLQKTGKVTTEEYNCVATFGFTSQRARVTLVYQRKNDGKIVMMTKGQDTVMMPLVKVKQDAQEALLMRLQDLSAKGLRTLMIAHAELQSDWWEQFAQQYLAAISMDESDASVGHPNKCKPEQCVKCVQHRLFENIEKSANMLYLGCMGLEDQLQPLVPETIRDCLRAKIKVWMITGDKLEAAKNIGLACNLIDADMEAVINAEEGLGDVMQSFQGSRLMQITGQWAELTGDPKELGKLFDMFDYNNDGKLTLEELSVFLEALDFSRPDAVKDLRTGRGDMITKAKFIELMQATALTLYDAVKYDIEQSIQRYNTIDDHEAYPISLLVNRSAFQVMFAAGTSETSDGLKVSAEEMEMLRKKFFFLASVSKSVIFARAEPAMKKRMVTEIQARYPAAVTLAVGDGANDTDMISAAHVGVGIAGVEGTAAVNSADYAIGTFNILHLLVLVHGYWCYDRVSLMVPWMFYKSGVLAVTMYLFGFESAMSGQQFYEDNIYNWYNIFLTAGPIILVCVFDKKLSRSTLQNNPTAYWEAKGRAFTHKRFFSWIIRAILYSLPSFYISYYATRGSIIGPSGLVNGFMYSSTLTYLVICCTPHLLILLICTTIDLILVGGIILSFILIFASFSILNNLFSVSVDFYGVTNMLYAQPQTWLILLISMSVPLLMEFTFRGFRRDLWPTYAQILQERFLLRTKDAVTTRLPFSIKGLLIRRDTTLISSDDSPLVHAEEYEKEWVGRKPLKKQKQKKKKDEGKTEETAVRQVLFKGSVIHAMLRFRNLTGAQFDSAAQAKYKQHDSYSSMVQQPLSADYSDIAPGSPSVLSPVPNNEEEEEEMKIEDRSTSSEPDAVHFRVMKGESAATLNPADQSQFLRSGGTSNTPRSTSRMTPSGYPSPRSTSANPLPNEVNSSAAERSPVLPGRKKAEPRDSEAEI
eukprot:gb/GEZN01000134.1/.p1 GENE.gb/GEZN01000134.1/~~gb/GEZN01000134.1/.p1  ORF type:complete len:1594 (-),score=227.78 gb/GEZN01000134.1/:1866-6419(-)